MISPDPAGSPDTTDLDRVIRSRRTTKLLDPDRPVDPAVIAELCELATWAPNHKKTEPWRFAVVTGDGRRRLGETLADALAATGGHEAKITKTRTKYFRAPVVVVVGSVPGADPVTTAENRDAVASAITLLLLSATARGLGTLWSSVSPAFLSVSLDAGIGPSPMRWLGTPATP